MSKATVDLEILVVRLIDAQKDSVDALKVVNQYLSDQLKALSEQYRDLQTKYNNLVAASSLKDNF
jgi:inorganic pyrophosphatase